MRGFIEAKFGSVGLVLQGMTKHGEVDFLGEQETQIYLCLIEASDEHLLDEPPLWMALFI